MQCDVKCYVITDVKKGKVRYLSVKPQNYAIIW